MNNNICDKFSINVFGAEKKLLDTVILFLKELSFPPPTNFPVINFEQQKN